MQPITIAFDNLADEKSKKNSLPEKLDKLNYDLGKMFKKTLDNFDKAINGSENVSHVAMDMRGVIQQIWGGLAELAKKNCPGNFKNIQRLQHKTDNHRKLVAQCFGKSKIDAIKVHQLLKWMYDLAGEISKTEFGKNPLSTDLNKLKEIKNRWVLQIDDLINLIGDF